MYVIWSFLSCNLLPTYRSTDVKICGPLKISYSKILSDVIFRTMRFSIRFKVGTRGIQSVRHRLECSSPQSAGLVRLELHTVQTGSTSKPAPRWSSRISIEANKTADWRRMTESTHAAKSRISLMMHCSAISGSLNFRITKFVLYRASVEGVITTETYVECHTYHPLSISLSCRAIPFLLRQPSRKSLSTSFSSFFRSSFPLSRFHAIHVGQPCSTQWQKTRARCELTVRTWQQRPREKINRAF